MPSRALASAAGALGQSAGSFSQALFGIDEKQKRQAKDAASLALDTRRLEAVEADNVADQQYRQAVLAGQQSDRDATAAYRTAQLGHSVSERAAADQHRSAMLASSEGARAERARAELRDYYKSVGWVPPGMTPDELGLPPGTDMGSFSQALATAFEAENRGRVGTSTSIPSAAQLADLYTVETPVMNDLGDGMTVSSGESVERLLMDPGEILAKRDSMVSGMSPTWPNVVDGQLSYPEPAAAPQMPPPAMATDTFSNGLRGGPPAANAAPPAGPVGLDTLLGIQPEPPPPTPLEQAQTMAAPGMSTDTGLGTPPDPQTELRGKINNLRNQGVSDDRIRQTLIDAGFDEVDELLGGG